MRSRLGAGTIAVASALVGACAVTFPEFRPEGGTSGSGVGSTADATSTGATTTDAATSTAGMGSSTSSGDGGGGDGGASPTSSSSSSEGGGSTTSDGGGPASSGGGEGGAGGAATCADVRVGTIEPGYDDDPDDCVIRKCGADGKAEEVADDDDDPPEEADACRERICDGINVADGEPIREGLACGPGAMVCDDGVCVGCDPGGPDSQCGEPTECSAPTCEESGACDPGFFDDTEILTDATPGDCQRPECPGNNVNPVNVDDNSDVPADLPCGDGGCNGGTPMFVNLIEGTACIGAVGVCDGLGGGAASCKTCRDTVGGVGQDPGCSVGAPICMELEGGGAGVCHTCLDDGTGPATDTGCAATDVCEATANGGVGQCAGCYGGATPVNCGAGEVCRDGDEDCANCADTGQGGVDIGCDPAFPACDQGTDSCEECQDDADCAARPEGHLCNQSGNDQCGCAGGGDSPSCTGSPRGTRCQASVACGCSGGAASSDCDHAGSAGPNCTAGFCGP